MKNIITEEMKTRKRAVEYAKNMTITQQRQESIIQADNR